MRVSCRTRLPPPPGRLHELHQNCGRAIFQPAETGEYSTGVATVKTSAFWSGQRFPVPPGESRAALHAIWEPGSIVLSGTGSSPIAADSGQILAMDCTDSLMQVSGSESPVQSKHEAAKLVSEANRFQFERISLQSPAPGSRKRRKVVSPSSAPFSSEPYENAARIWVRWRARRAQLWTVRCSTT